MNSCLENEINILKCSDSPYLYDPDQGNFICAMLIFLYDDTYVILLYCLDNQETASSITYTISRSTIKVYGKSRFMQNLPLLISFKPICEPSRGYVWQFGQVLSESDEQFTSSSARRINIVWNKVRIRLFLALMSSPPKLLWIFTRVW